jgi:hypothetical protein
MSLQDDLAFVDDMLKEAQSKPNVSTNMIPELETKPTSQLQDVNTTTPIEAEIQHIEEIVDKTQLGNALQLENEVDQKKTEVPTATLEPVLKNDYSKIEILKPVDDKIDSQQETSKLMPQDATEVVLEKTEKKKKKKKIGDESHRKKKKKKKPEQVDTIAAPPQYFETYGFSIDKDEIFHETIEAELSPEESGGKDKIEKDQKIKDAKISGVKTSTKQKVIWVENPVSGEFYKMKESDRQKALYEEIPVEKEVNTDPKQEYTKVKGDTEKLCTNMLGACKMLFAGFCLYQLIATYPRFDRNMFLDWYPRISIDMQKVYFVLGNICLVCSAYLLTAKRDRGLLMQNVILTLLYILILVCNLVAGSVEDYLYYQYNNGGFKPVYESTYSTQIVLWHIFNVGRICLGIIAMCSNYVLETVFSNIRITITKV